MNMNDLLTITHTGDEYEKYLGAVVPPIFMNSLHVFPDFESYLNFDDYKEDSFIYGRESNPTAHIMERKIAELEHGTMALAFASGMAAGTAARHGHLQHRQPYHLPAQHLRAFEGFHLQILCREIPYDRDLSSWNGP